MDAIDAVFWTQRARDGRGLTQDLAIFTQKEGAQHGFGVKTVLQFVMKNNATTANAFGPDPRAIPFPAVRTEANMKAE